MYYCVLERCESMVVPGSIEEAAAEDEKKESAEGTPEMPEQTSVEQPEIQGVETFDPSEELQKALTESLEQGTS